MIAPFAGQTAFVTGTARGLGAAIAAALHRRGANVVCADIDGDANAAMVRTLDAAGTRAQALSLDLADPAAIALGFAASLARWGRIEILVNNAAIARATSLWEITAAEWDAVQSVNLRGLFLLTRAAALQMRANAYGRIINIASLAGQMARPSGAHYAAAKGGVLALTRVFAAELAGAGVTVNAVAPAILDTPMLRMLPAERVAHLVQAIPVQQVGRPEDVAALVCFLAAREAGFVTGATYDINGGMLMR